MLSASVKGGCVKLWSWGKEEVLQNIRHCVLPNVFLQPKYLSIRSAELKNDVIDMTCLSHVAQTEDRLKKLLAHILSTAGRAEAGATEVHALDKKEKQLVAGLLHQCTQSRAEKENVMPTMDAAIWAANDRRVITMQSFPTKRSSKDIINTIAADVDHNRDVSVFCDQMLKIWDSVTGNLLYKLRQHRRPSYCIIPHPVVSNVVATLGQDSQIIFWDVELGKMISRMTVPSVLGPASLLDGLFIPNRSRGKGNVDMIVTDSLGRFSLLSSRSTEIASETAPAAKNDASVCTIELNSTYSEQFFKNDFAELTYDAEGNCVDSVTQVSPHLCPATPLCDATLEPYSVQPRRANASRREPLVRQLDLMNDTREKNAMAAIENKLQLMDMYISFARLADDVEHPPDYKYLLKQVLNQASAAPQPSNQVSRRRSTAISNVSTTSVSVSVNQPQRRSERQRERARTGVTPGFIEMARRASATSLGNEEASEELQSAHRFAPRRRAARRAGERIRRFRDLSLQRSSGSPVQRTPVIDWLNDDSEYSASEEEYQRLSDLEDPEQIIRQNRRKKKKAAKEAESKNYLRRSTRLRNRVPTSHSSSTAISGEESEESAEYDEEEEEDEDEEDVAIANTPQNAYAFSNQGRYSCSWLRLEQIDHTYGGYVPQLGDEVVLCQQGFLEYLSVYRRMKDIRAAKQVSERLIDFPYLLCRLNNLNYFFPSGNRATSILAEIDLQVIATPLKKFSSSRIWNVISERETFRLRLIEHDLADFLILRKLFEESVRQQFFPRDQVMVYFADETGELESYTGSINSVNDADPYRFPKSVWKSLTVEWHETFFGSSDKDGYSPWEVQKKNDPVSIREVVSQGVAVSPMICERIRSGLEDLMEERYCLPFVEEVNCDIVLGYSSAVEVPMELSLVCRRLENGFYRTIESIKFDIELIYSNCIKFNRSDSLITQDGLKVRQQALKIVKRAVAGMYDYMSSGANRSLPDESSNVLNGKRRHSRSLVNEVDVEQGERMQRSKRARSSVSSNLSYAGSNLGLRRSARSSITRVNYEEFM